MPKYKHKASIDVYEKKTSFGDIVGGIIGFLVVIFIIAALAG